MVCVNIVFFSSLFFCICRPSYFILLYNIHQTMAGLSKTKQIEKKFGAHIAGSKEVKRLVSEAISLFPKELVNYIIKNIWFAASFDDAWAFTFDGNDLKGKHLIFLSDDLLAQSRYQIFHSIAHEI